MHAITIRYAAAITLSAACHAQPIDFESFPDGTPTTDRETISDQYLAAFGVRFDIVDGTTLLPIGSPQIAKVGAPQTAFVGCGPDTPLDGEGVGQSFITDDNQISDQAGSLLLTYSSPVSQACGVVIDVDGRLGPAYEKWTIEALDASQQVLETVVITAPEGPDVCTNNNGPGDARALGFAFDRPGADIAFVSMRYTGTANNIGLAFDQFFPDSIPPAPNVTATASVGTPCYGDPIQIQTEVTGGLPGLRYRWQQAAPGEPFADIQGETASTLDAPALPGYAFRVVVADALGRESVSDAVTVGAVNAVAIDLLIETGPGTGQFDLAASGVQPAVFDASIDTVYAWTVNQQYYHGQFPTLATDRSHLFLTAAVGGQSIVLIHDAVGVNGGGRAETEAVFTGVAPDYVSRDDPADTYDGGGTGTLRTRHNWTSPNTDGWAAGPLTGSWTATVRFADVLSGSPTIDGLNSWVFVDADGTEHPLPLIEDRAVRLEARCACPADLAPPFGSLNFFDIAEFIARYTAQDPDADLAAPYGVFNFFDVAAYIALYNGGCP